ncbi:fatty acid desaturase family protein [Flavihumibacter profundi]|jgi:linoleoyl-CoA desaturase|uniref:fatty acid desaturase family protein n=1 Tax=Flavihumibacter profundi TaxID=2716883 RepID=UPI001CC4B9FD|nr:fatty acid desaturase [Flavihumibacter profundi]MBZ5859537.1 fatty acid desaturase [Flavihumibacter profundi]
MVDPKTDNQLFQELKERINMYFEESGKSKFCDWIMWLKMILFGIITVVGYIFLLQFGGMSLMSAFTGFILFIIGAALFVVSVAHDASHHALFKGKQVNKWMSFSWNIIGVSKYLWEIKHHHSHHIYTNIPDQDVDIAKSPLLRFSPTYPYRHYYKYQHFYAAFLYGVFGIYIVFIRDFIMYFSKQLKNHGVRQLPRNFLARMIFTKSVFLIVSFLIPLLVLPFAWWHVLILYLIAMGISGSLLLLVLVVPHINTEAASTMGSHDINNRNDWVLHQIHSTVDSSPGNRLLNFFCGGLNTHLVHHLFPNICHTHYFNLTKIIKKVLQDYNIPYLEKTFADTIADHFHYLKMMGIKPSVMPA